MNIDFSKLSPTTRHNLFYEMKRVLSTEAGVISWDLNEFDGDKNSDYYKEMTNWKEACWDLHAKISKIK